MNDYYQQLQSRRRREAVAIAVFGVLLVLTLLTAVLGRGAWVSESTAVEVMQTHGFSEVEVVGHAWLFVGARGCDRNDAARFTVRAANPAGERVEVYVCAGLLKGGTIRGK